MLVNDAKWHEAFSIFGTLVELFPNAPQAYDSLAYAYFRADEVEQARETFSIAFKLKPAFAGDYSSDNYGYPAFR